MKRTIPAFAQEMCCSLPCLETHWQEYPLSNLFHDQLGYYWCPCCTLRGQLANWAVEHGCPEVRVGLHMAGPGEALWKVAVTMGKDAMMEALWRAIHPGEREEEAA